MNDKRGGGANGFSRGSSRHPSSMGSRQSQRSVRSGGSQRKISHNGTRLDPLPNPLDVTVPETSLTTPESRSSESSKSKKKKKTILIVKNPKDNAKRSKKKTVLISRKVNEAERETAKKVAVAAAPAGTISDQEEGIKYAVDGTVLERTILGTTNDFEEVDRMLAGQESVQLQQSASRDITPSPVEQGSVPSLGQSHSNASLMSQRSGASSPGPSSMQSSGMSTSKRSRGRKGMQRPASRTKSKRQPNPAEDRANYLETLRQAVSNAARIRSIQHKRENEMMALLPVNEKFSLNRDSSIIEHWKKRQREWNRLNKLLAKKSGKRETDTVLVRSEGYREKTEVLAAIQAAIPPYEKYSGAFWEMGLRNHGQRYAQVGNIFSGLFCPLQDDRPITFLVRRPGVKPFGPSLVLTDTGEFRPMKTWKDSKYLQRKKRTLHKRIAELNPVPQVLDPDSMEGLIVRSSNLLEWALDSSVEYFESTSIQDMEKQLGQPIPELDESLMLSSRPATALASVGARLTLETHNFLVMTTSARLPTSATVTLRNTGSAAIYFKWSRSMLPPDVVSTTLPQPDPHVFHCQASKGHLLPGMRATTTFGFCSRSPGLFSDQWELSSTPNATFLLEDPKQEGEQTLDQIVVRLRGVSTQPDTEQHNRTVLKENIDTSTLEYKMETLIRGVVRTVKTPIREAAVRAAQKERFVSKNSDQNLKYTPQFYDDLKLLFHTCKDQVKDQYKTLGSISPLIDSEWDETGKAVREVADRLWKFWDPSLKDFKANVSEPILEQSLSIGQYPCVHITITSGSMPGELALIDCAVEKLEKLEPEIKKVKKSRIKVTLQAFKALVSAHNVIDVHLDVKKMARFENRRFLAQYLLDKVCIPPDSKKQARLKGLEGEVEIYSVIKDPRPKKDEEGDSDEEEDESDVDDEEEEDEDEEEDFMTPQQPKEVETFSTKLYAEVVETLAKCELRPLYPIDGPAKGVLAQYLADVVVDAAESARTAVSLPEDHMPQEPIASPFATEEGAKKWKLLLEGPDEDVHEEEETGKGKKKEKKGKSKELPWEEQPLQIFRKKMYEIVFKGLSEICTEISDEILQLDEDSLEGHHKEQRLTLGDRAILRDGHGLIGIKKASELATGSSEDLRGRVVVVQLNLNLPDIANSSNVSFPQGGDDPEVLRAAAILHRIEACKPSAIIIVSKLQNTERNRRSSGFHDLMRKTLTLRPFESLLSERVDNRVKFFETIAEMRKYIKKYPESTVLLEHLTCGKLLPTPEPEVDNSPDEEEVIFNFGLEEEEAAEAEERKEREMDIGLALSEICDVFIQNDSSVLNDSTLSLSSLTPKTGMKLAGPHLHVEMNALSYLLERPKRPFVAMLGGAGLQPRVQLLGHLLDHVDTLVLGGALALTFLRAIGQKVGRCEKGMEGCDPSSIFPVARLLLSKAYRRGVKMILPVDFVMGEQQLNFAEFPAEGRLKSSHANPKIAPGPEELLTTGINTPLTELEDSLASGPETPLSRAGRSDYDYRPGDSYDGSASIDSGPQESYEGGSFRDDANQFDPEGLVRGSTDRAMSLTPVDEAFERSLEGSDATGAVHVSLMKGLISYSNEWPDNASAEGGNGVEYEAETMEIALGSTKMPSQWIAYDLGPQTVNTIKTEISNAGTVLWDGLLGVCESAAFQTSTRDILEALVTTHDRDTEDASQAEEPADTKDDSDGKEDAEPQPPKEPATTFFVGYSTTLWVKRFLREDFEDGLVPGQGFSHFSVDSRFAQIILSGKPVEGIQNLSRRRPMAEELALLEEILKLKEKAAELDDSEDEDGSDEDDLSYDEKST